MTKALTTSRRSELRAKAHALKPVVLLGDKGLTDSVVAEINRALLSHELIKVRASSDDRDRRSAWLAEICEKCEAAAVQEIGKIFVLYRENPEKKVPPPPVAARPVRAAVAPKRKKPARKKPVIAEKLKRTPLRGKATPRGKPLPRARMGGRLIAKEARRDRPPRDEAAQARPPAGKKRGPAGGSGEAPTGTGRQRSRAPSPRPASEPRRRRPRTSR